MAGERMENEPDGAPAPPPSASPVVRLELEILAADMVAREAPVDTPAHTPARTVLVVSAESNVRTYIRQNLGRLPNVMIVEAAGVEEALVMTTHEPHLVIVDAPHAAILPTLRKAHIILIAADDPSGTAPAGDRVRVLARPFTTEGLLAEVNRVLA